MRLTAYLAENIWFPNEVTVITLSLLPDSDTLLIIGDSSFRLLIDKLQQCENDRL